MNTIKFLGTAGPRDAVIRQLLASGGIWYSLDGTQVVVDPGPGTLVRAIASRPNHPVCPGGCDRSSSI